MPLTLRDIHIVAGAVCISKNTLLETRPKTLFISSVVWFVLQVVGSSKHVEWCLFFFFSSNLVNKVLEPRLQFSQEKTVNSSGWNTDSMAVCTIHLERSKDTGLFGQRSNPNPVLHTI